MSFTPDEIKDIEIIIEGIEKVIGVISQQLEQFVYDRSNKTHCLDEGKTLNNICQDVLKASGYYLTVSVPPSNLIKDILAKLYWDKPEIAKDFKETYNRYQYDVSQLFQIKDADNLYEGLFNIQYNLSELARNLQAGTKIADLARKKATETKNIDPQEKDGQSKKQPKKIVQKSKYTPEKIKNMLTSYDKHFEERNDVKYAWNCVAEEHSIKSGKAAEMAVRRHQEKNK